MLWRDPRHDNVQRIDRGTEWFRIEDGLIAEVRAYHHSDARTASGDLLGFDHAGRGYTTLERWDEVRSATARAAIGCRRTDFAEAIAAAYATTGPAIELGRGVHDGALVPRGRRPGAAGDDEPPRADRRRHRHRQDAARCRCIAEQLSAAGVPVFVADVKGDLSGSPRPARPTARRRSARPTSGSTFAPAGFPVEFLSLGGIGPGVPVRATVSDFGPQLLAKILEANETQEQSLALVFRYADEKGLPLLDLSDLRALLTFLDSDEGKAELKGIGGLSSADRRRAAARARRPRGRRRQRVLRRAAVRHRRPAAHGARTVAAIISCLELPAVQDKPRLFSTALMWLLAELFEELPEVGDLDKPKLVFFFDEAHLLFDGATKAFLESVTQTVRLIRSKGVGVFFVTQTPKDIPADVLGQLGNRIQHALRAFTPDDAKALKATVSTFPKSRVLRPRGAADPAGDRRGGGHDPLGVRRARRRSCTRGWSRRHRGWDRPTTSMRRPRPRRCTPSTAPAGRRRAPARCWPRGSTRRPRTEARRGRRAQGRAQAGRLGGGGGVDAIGEFLKSRQGKQIQREVVRGVFGMLKKKL